MMKRNVLRLILSILLGIGIITSSYQAYAGEEGIFIEVHRKANRMVVLANDVPVYSFPVSTGKATDLTPLGEFRIVTKVINPWYLPQDIPGGSPENPLGTRWLGINVPGTNGYKYGIHGTNEPWLIGVPFSSGCVRMRNEDVEWVFRHIPLGTKVVIIDK